MAMVPWPIEQIRRLSRRAVAGLLGGVSVLVSRPAINLLTAISEQIEFGFTLFFLYLSVAGGGLVGHYVSWLFVGYFVYAYLPELYLGFYGKIVEDRIFRVLSTVATVSFAILLSRTLGIVPDEAAFTLLPGGPTSPLEVIVFGGLASVFAFSGYVHIVRSERRYDEGSQHAKVVEEFGINSDPEASAQQIRTLPDWSRRVVIIVNELISGAIYVLPCFFLGLVLAVMSLFSPIPEGLVVVGVLVSYSPIGDQLPDQASTDIEFQIIDDVTDSLQNHKGVALALFCCCGLGTAGVSIFLSMGVIVSAAGLILSDLMAVTWSGLSLTEVGRILAYVWIGGGIIISLSLYGLYGLVYWFLQLKRLPVYVEFWDQYYRGEVEKAPQSSVRRPPGLFLPAVALLTGIAGLAWLLWNDILWPGIISYGLAWPAIGGIAVWSGRAVYVGNPQSLDAEGRDVTIALILQIISFFVFGSMLARFAGTRLSVGFMILPLVVLIIGGFGYFPDVYRYSVQQKGVLSYLLVIYLGGLGILLLLFLETMTSVPVSMYIIIIFCVILITIFTYIKKKYNR